MARRQIIKIDEDRCDGCGLCVPSCAEGAIQIVDGKARLVRDDFCDGLGACLGECPNDALSIEEREAPEFDEAAVAVSRRKAASPPPAWPDVLHRHGGHGHPGGGCPSARILDLAPRRETPQPGGVSPRAPSALEHWPVKLKLVPPTAPFLRGADLMLAADCVPFAYAGMHGDLLPDHAVVIGCPKFDDYLEARARLTEILRVSSVRSLTVVTMEVPCCLGYLRMAQEALSASGKDIPLRHVVIGVRGDLREAGGSASWGAAIPETRKTS